MNDLSNFLVESILLEADSVDNKVVVYAGRFQPFHKGHYATYSHLVKKFGKDNVYIGTSNKTDNQKSPFNFKEKVMIMNTMFGIPKNRIVQVKNPYVPTEVLKKFDKDTTAFITVVGKKDASRLGGKFFTPYKDNLDFEGYEDKGYVYIAPQQSNPISGTDVRKGTPGVLYRNDKPISGKIAFAENNKRTENLAIDPNSPNPSKYPGYRAEGLLTNQEILIVPRKKDPDNSTGLNAYFAMGDNSTDSLDGRAWGFVPENEIIGRAFVVYYPFTKRWGFSN